MTYGIGYDLWVNPDKRGFFSFGVLVPIRDKAVEDYMSDLEKNHNVEFKTGLFPIGISLGYRVIFN